VRTAALAAVMAGISAASVTGGAAPGRTASPGVVSVTLPAPVEAFPGGPEAEPARRRCLLCHSSDYVYTQPKLTKAQWTSEVTKMIKVYGAPIPDDDVPAIVDYLVVQNGKT
jgi:cytochrome c5